MTKKIQLLKVYYTEAGHIMNASAYDEAGQLRTDITTDKPGAIWEFIAGLEDYADSVQLESVKFSFKKAG